MPGAYAHLTLVRQAAAWNGLKTRDDITDEAKKALSLRVGYAELGAVSPDLPYLALMEGKSKEWADNMHKRHTVQLIRALVRAVDRLSGDDRLCAVAWLLGYLSHVVMDMVVHPVVARVINGEYEGHEREHRVCEMHQDVYVFKRLNVGPIHLANYLATGIGACHDPATPGVLHEAVAGPWLEAMDRVFPERSDKNPPMPRAWYRQFQTVLSAAGNGQRLVPFARHVLAGAGLVYPARHNARYVSGISSPAAQGIHYDAVFDHARLAVLDIWAHVSTCLETEEKCLPGHDEWSLDTGRERGGDHVFY